MSARETVVPATTASDGRRSMRVDILLIAFVYLGAAALVQPTSKLAPNIGRLDLSLVAAVFVGLVGWRRVYGTKLFSSYIVWAGLLSAWVFIGWIAEWQFYESSYHVRTFILYLIVVVPGVAALLREARYRNALIAGLAAEAIVYCFTGVFRFVSGRKIFDVPGRPRTVVVLDMGRNAINVLALLAIPLILSRRGWSLAVRLPLVGVIAAFIALSGGRGGLVGLIFMGIVYVMIQPGGSRVLRALYAVVLAAAIFYVGLDALGGQATEASNRLLATLRGEKSTSTESRELLLKKSWHLAADNPLFGVGRGDFGSTYDPLIDQEATSERVRDYVATQADEHNTYAEILAESGFPGLFFFVSMLIVVWRVGWRYRRAPEMRSCATAFACLALQLVVVGDLVLGGLFFIPIALLLGMSEDPEVQAEATHGPAPVLRRYRVGR